MSIDPSDPNVSADQAPIPTAFPASALLRGAVPVTRPAGAEAGGRKAGQGTGQETGQESGQETGQETGKRIAITSEARRRIGRSLRLQYAEILNQPLPDRFDALLADLAARSETRGSS